MQFSVPQFTDVEDRIIGPLTLRQFFILLGVGAILFMVWSSTKNIPVFVGACVIFGLPGLALAFLPFNGRPMYKSLPIMVKYLFAPKEYRFRREGLASRTSNFVMTRESQPVQKRKDTSDIVTKLQRVEYQLKQRQEREESLAEELTRGK